MKRCLKFTYFLSLLMIQIDPNCFAAPAASSGQSELIAEMVLVKGGCYEMGDTFKDGMSSERPVHSVCVSDFYLGKFPVTQKEYANVMGKNPSEFKDCDACPVEMVSWNDAKAFIQKFNEKTRKRIRLPTEAEWEYAARSGGRKEKWAGVSDETVLDQYAWFGENAQGRTHPVGLKKPNGLGLYDMTGNVWEWVEDWLGPNYYQTSPKDNPKGPSSGEYHVLRGGSWSNNSANCRTSFRTWLTVYERVNTFGFRIAATAFNP